MKRIAAAAALMVLMLGAGMGFNQIPDTVSAAEYDGVVYTQEQYASVQKTQEQYEAFLENSPYGLYEQLTETQRATYNKLLQFIQKRNQWKQQRLPFTEPRDLEAEAAEAARIAAEEEARRIAEAEEAARRAAEEQARLEEELRKVWHNPLPDFGRVSSPFGMRYHPISGTWSMHKGIDLTGATGTEIYAARGGVVVAAGWHDDFGYYVRIDHGDGFQSEYFHMSRYCVSRGDVVESCDLIGKVGSTGLSTGPHLHFGIILDDTHVDPEDYIDFSK